MRENVVTVLEVVADELGDQPAIVQGEPRVPAGSWTTRADRLATLLAECGLGRGDRVAIAAYNGPEYVESLLAAIEAARRACRHQLPLPGRGAGRCPRRRRRVRPGDGCSLTAEVARACAELPRLRA